MGPEFILIAAPTGALVVCSVLAVISLKKVPPWARLVVFRFGLTGPDLVFGPGRKLVVPFVDRAELVDMREQTVKLPRQTVVTSDGAPRGVECQVRYQIVDALKSQINVHNIRTSIQGVTSSMLREAIGGTHSTDLQARRTKIAEDVHVRLGETIARWGVRVLKVEIVEIGSPHRTVQGDTLVAP